MGRELIAGSRTPTSSSAPDSAPAGTSCAVSAAFGTA